MKKILILMCALLALGTGCWKDNSGDNALVPTLSMGEFEQLMDNNKGKVLLINVFASWCPPCKVETPGFVNFYNEHGNEDFELIGLSIDKSKKDIVDFVEQYNITYPVYHITASIQRKLLADKIPTTLIFRPDGEYYTTILGAIDERTLEYLVQMLNN